MKGIDNFIGLYSITENGNVISLSRWSNAGKQGYLKKERILKPSPDKNGYFKVRLCKDNKYENKFLHRLVAEAFIPNPDNKLQINHKNGIKTDNRVENLEWCTARENTMHAINNRLRTTIGSKQWKSKLTEEDVRMIRKLSSVKTATELSNKFNVCRDSIYLIINYKSWKHVT